MKSLIAFSAKAIALVSLQVLFSISKTARRSLRISEISEISEISRVRRVSHRRDSIRWIGIRIWLVASRRETDDRVFCSRSRDISGEYPGEGYVSVRRRFIAA